MKNSNVLPDLPFNEWANTRLTLHLIFQIMGKARLKLTPRKNHWWFITIYVTPRGFSTYSIPANHGLESFEMEFNVFKKAVIFTKSTGEEIIISLLESPSVAKIYNQFMLALKKFGHKPEFVEKPFDLEVTKPFKEITEYHHYDWNYIKRFWDVMRWNNNVFNEFSGRFYGKTCPVHIYWHHLDLTVTRFSGKKLPPQENPARILEKDTYSHEQISFGFWVGDNNIREPMYYSYTYPSPEDLDKEVLSPDTAKWVESNGSPMALLRYADVRGSDNPREIVLEFLESAYQAGAKKANWKIDELRVPPLKEL